MDGTDERTRKMPDRPIASVKKALDVLDILAFEDMEHHGVALAELAARLGQKPNTLHGILKTMVACGYVEQDEHARYRTGRRCEQIGIINQFRMQPDTARKLNQRLLALCDETGESVSFYVLKNGDRINYLNYQTRDIIKVDYSMLEKNSLYEYPSGRVLVAFASETERDQLLSKHGLPKRSWNGIVNRAQLETEMANVRRDRVLTRKTQDVASFAGPVFHTGGQLLGSVGVYLPIFRLTPQKEQYICEKLQRFADEPV